MPLLLIQWVTLRINHWFTTQAVTDIAIAPPNLGQVFVDIELGQRWEPVLSPGMLMDFGSTWPQPSPILPPALPTPAPSPAVPRRVPPPVNPLPNQMVTNDAFKEDIFGEFKARNIGHAALRNRITVRPLLSPFSSTGGEMCLSWHIKGICNVRCARADDHRTHTVAQDQSLVDWCVAHYNAA